MTAKIIDLAAVRSARATATAATKQPTALELLEAVVAAARAETPAAPAKPVYKAPEEVRGEKFDRSLSTAEIARRCREELKAMVKSGALPKGVKVSVRSDSFSGGSSIRVRVVACPFAVLAEERMALEIREPHTFHSGHHYPRLRPEATALLETITAVFSAYNRDASDISTDYFNTNFYDGRAEFCSDLTNAEERAFRTVFETCPLPV